MYAVVHRPSHCYLRIDQFHLTLDGYLNSTSTSQRSIAVPIAPSLKYRFSSIPLKKTDDPSTVQQFVRLLQMISVQLSLLFLVLPT